ncbi:LysR substrate-binding domain-containing protein [Pseudomonas sp. JZ134]|uniref:LysR substrate-binding domain-containing protein n=1 Tax=Pseudomonas sp. JZ134 TaxID=2806615 RepID=UPI003DA07B1C
MSLSLDIELLRTFHTVVKTGRFLAAAVHLNRSASAVSLHIRRLEHIAGGKLFERDNQSVSLTALGQQFTLQTAELLALHDRIMGRLVDQPVRGKVRLGVPDDHACKVVDGLFAQVSSAYPHIELEIETATSGQLRHRLDQGQLDLALVVQAYKKDTLYEPSLEILQPVWVASSALQVNDKEPLPLALHGEGCPYRSMAIETLERQGRRWRLVMQSANSGLVMSAVEAGVAIGIADLSSLSQQVRVLTEKEGFPSLGAHELRLLCAPAADCDVHQLIANMVARLYC